MIETAASSRSASILAAAFLKSSGVLLRKGFIKVEEVELDPLLALVPTFSFFWFVMTGTTLGPYLFLDYVGADEF